MVKFTDEERKVELAKLRATPEWKAFNAQRNSLMGVHQTVHRLKIEKKIRAFEDNYIEQLEKGLTRKVEKVNVASLGLSNESVKKISELSVAMHMSCDIIEGLCIDLEDELKRYDKSLSFEDFADLIEVGKEAKKKIKWLSEKTSLYKEVSWGYKCDDMSKLLRNKARSLLID